MDEQDEGETNGADDKVERLVAAVMVVERRFGHALRGAKSDRLEGIRAAIEQTLGADK